MGRRSSHTPQQLRELILAAAEEIIETHGLTGLSAREIARKVGYSAGTIYNMFENLDDVILHVEARVLDALAARIATVADAPEGPDKLLLLARTYLSFTQEKPKLWNLLFEHHLPPGVDLPKWYKDKLESLLGHVEQTLAPMFPPGNTADLQRSARVLWASVHGITSLATADKLSTVTSEAASRLIEDLVVNYVAGLTARKG